MAGESSRLGVQPCLFEQHLAQMPAYPWIPQADLRDRLGMEIAGPIARLAATDLDEAATVTVEALVPAPSPIAEAMFFATTSASACAKTPAFGNGLPSFNGIETTSPPTPPPRRDGRHRVARRRRPGVVARWNWPPRLRPLDGAECESIQCVAAFRRANPRLRLHVGVARRCMLGGWQQDGVRCQLCWCSDAGLPPLTARVAETARASTRAE